MFNGYKRTTFNGLKEGEIFCFEGHENDLQKKVITEILVHQLDESVLIATFVPEYTPVRNSGVINLNSVVDIRQCEGFKVLTLF